MPHSIRPIRPSDKGALAEMVLRLSPETRLRRFHAPKPSLTARERAYFTEVDHRRHAALVAVDDERIVGVARYATWHGEDDRAEVAFVVADEWQGRGLGTALGRELVALAMRNGMRELTGSTLAANDAAHALLRRLGFTDPRTSAGVTEYRLTLSAARLPAAA